MKWARKLAELKRTEVKVLILPVVIPRLNMGTPYGLWAPFLSPEPGVKSEQLWVWPKSQNNNSNNKSKVQKVQAPLLAQCQGPNLTDFLPRRWAHSQHSQNYGVRMRCSPACSALAPWAREVLGVSCRVKPATPWARCTFAYSQRPKHSAGHGARTCLQSHPQAFKNEELFSQEKKKKIISTSLGAGGDVTDH